MKYESYAVEIALATKLEVENAARWCARKGYKHYQDGLPNLISVRAYTFIENNPYAFHLMIEKELQNEKQAY